MKTSLHLPAKGWSRTGNGSTESVVPRLGLVLSSGGARGLAHAGVIQVLEEASIPIAAISGASMGAYVGALWSSGLDGKELEKRAAEISNRKTLKSLLDVIIPPSEGLIRGERLRKHLERDLGQRTFAELGRKLLVVATDLDELAPYVFDSGVVSHAVHASAAIPAICAPFHYGGRRFTDGGTSEPLPVRLLLDRVPLDYVIAVNVMPMPGERHADHHGPAAEHLFSRLFHKLNLLAPGNVLDTFRSALMSAQLRLIAKEELEADVVIRPRVAESSWHDFENYQRYILAGREAALAALPQIRALLNPEPTTHHETRLERRAA